MITSSAFSSFSHFSKYVASRETWNHFSNFHLFSQANNIVAEINEGKILKVEVTGSTSSGEMAFNCFGLFNVTTLTWSISSPTTTLTSKPTTTTMYYLDKSCRNPFLMLGSNYKHNLSFLPRKDEHARREWNWSIKSKDWRHDSGLTCSSGIAEFGAIEVNTAQSNQKWHV